MFQADLDSVPGCLGEGPPPRYRGSLSGSLLWAEPLGQQLRAIYEPAALPSLVPPSTAALTQPPAIFHAHQDLGFHHFPVGKSGWGEFECSFISYIMLTLLGGGITGGDRQVLGIGDKLPASLFPARRGCGPCRPPEALSSDGFEYLCLDLPKGSWDLNPGVTGVVFSFIHSFNRYVTSARPGPSTGDTVMNRTWFLPPCSSHFRVQQALSQETQGSGRAPRRNLT